MVVQGDGSLKFTGKDEKVFIFERKNYDEHCIKHPSLKLEYYLEDMQRVLATPHCITEGPQKGRNTYYGVLRNIGITQLHVLKIPVFAHQKVYFVASAYDFWTSPTNVIHYLEKVVWKEVNFLFF